MLSVGEVFFFRARFSAERPRLGEVYGPVRVIGEDAVLGQPLLVVQPTAGHPIRLPVAVLKACGRPVATATVFQAAVAVRGPDAGVLALPWSRRHRLLFSLLLEGTVADAVRALWVLDALRTQRPLSFSERHAFDTARCALIEEGTLATAESGAVLATQLPGS